MDQPIRSIAVFCGASLGNDPAYGEQAYLLGKLMAQRNISLIYGGAKVGIMGKVADGVRQNGGKAIGIIPSFLKTMEVAHDDLSQLIEVDNMHERKLQMYEMADAIIALPGGFGTLDELFEVLTWKQLGLHQKPTGILNVNGYYDDLFRLVENMVDKGVLKEIYAQMLMHDTDMVHLLAKLQQYSDPNVSKWMNRDQV